MRNMSILQIIEMPDCFEDTKRGKCHESILRSFQTLQLVKDWLRLGTPPSVILEVLHHIDEMASPQEKEGKGE